MRGFALCALVCAAAGCKSMSGRLLEDAGARVFLTEGNYRVVKAHVVGESTGFFLLMFIPISSPSYNEAKANMYTALGEPVAGRSIALTNQTEDLTQVNALLYATRTITLSADFIEFLGPNAAPKPLAPIGQR
jgi:hypothetical protein